MTPPLYEIGSEKIGLPDFVKALKGVGVNKGEVVFVHSDISVFGKLGSLDKKFLLKSLVKAIKERVGKSGTIIIPTFTYSFCKKEIFDILESKSTVGVLTEFFRKQPGVMRTNHPIFSVTIWGKHKSNFLNIGKDSFDESSIFGKLHQQRGKILFLGAPFQSCTFIHYLEQSHGVPYRYKKTFKGKVKNNGGEHEDEVTYLVRYLDKNVILDLSRLERHLINKGLIKERRLGNGRILAIEADVLFNEGYKLLDKDIYFFLKEKPDL